MANEENDQSQKSALGKGLAEVLARGPEKPVEESGEEEKDVKTQAQEFLLSIESRIRKVSGSDVDITDVEIEYLQARTAFAVGNFQGALDYLGKITSVLEDLEQEAKETPPPPPEEESPPPPGDDEEDTEADAPEEEDNIPPPPHEDAPGDQEDGEQGEDGSEGEEDGGEEVLPEDQPMIFCMMCGEKITEGSLFCNWCGEKVD